MGNHIISGNGPDGADAATAGPKLGINIYGVSPVYATEILENTIDNEALDIVMHNAGEMDVRLNNLLGGGGRHSESRQGHGQCSSELLWLCQWPRDNGRMLRGE